MAPTGELEDIDDEEVIKAYENINLSNSLLDNQSQRSGNYGGNGNPNKLPGISDHHPGRKTSVAGNLGERNSSVGSASGSKT